MVDLALGNGDGHIMPLRGILNPGMPSWDIAVPEEPEPPVATAVQHLPAATVALKCAIKGKSTRPPPAIEDAIRKDSALKSWCEITDAMGDAFGARAKVGQLTPAQLAPFFGLKRPGTLETHASAWRLFLRYTQEKALDPRKLDESLAYDYLVYIADQGAPPTRGPAFLKANNFAFGVLEFMQGNCIAQSARCRGVAALAHNAKSARRQRDPLTVAQLQVLENEVAQAADGKGVLSTSEAVVAGYLVFCVHARARAADASKIVIEPSIDEAPDGDPECSFVEAVTTGDQVKSGNTDAKAKLPLPVVGLARGVTNVQWASAWLTLRASKGFDAAADGTLMREPFSNGEFGVARLCAGQATEWLRFLLCKLGFDPSTLTNVGSHSCKTTMLSIAAKAGMVRDYRRILGGHALPGDTSVDVYSRHALAAPLLELGKILTKIRNGVFNPDSSRSGRWTRERPMPDGISSFPCHACHVPLSTGTGFECVCGQWVHNTPMCVHVCEFCGGKFCKVCSKKEKHFCEVSDSDDSESNVSDSENGSDEEQVQMALEEEEVEIVKSDSKQAYIEKGLQDGANAVFPEGGIVVNVFTNVAHMVRDQEFTACGICTPDTKFSFYYEQTSLADKFLCWRSGCAKWMKTEDDSDSQSMTSVNSSSS